MDEIVNIVLLAGYNFMLEQNYIEDNQALHVVLIYHLLKNKERIQELTDRRFKIHLSKRSS